MIILGSESRHSDEDSDWDQCAPSAANDNRGAPYCDYAKAAEDYASVGIATVPTLLKDCKHPKVTGPGRVRVQGSLALARKHPVANVGMICGERNGITVVDIDSPLLAELHWAREQFGETPLVVRSGSGNHHAYYKHDGERRQIKPIANRPIDILGEGSLCVLPPSVRHEVGQYHFVLGDLSNFKSLPPIREGALAKLTKPSARTMAGANRRGALADAELAKGIVLEGHRNDQLWLFGIAPALAAESYGPLVAVLAAENGRRFRPPLDQDEVEKVATSLWAKKMKGELWEKGVQRVVMKMPTVKPLLDGGLANAFMLHALLASMHWDPPGKLFAIAGAAMARDKVLGSWPKERYAKAAKKLCELGILILVHQGGRYPGDASQFRFADGALH